MPTKMTATLALCLGGGLAAGIALARPATSSTPAPVAAPAPATTAAPGYGDSSAEDPATPAEPIVMTIEGFAFSAVTAPAGATITVNNVDGAPHTATSTDGLFDTANIAGGASGSFVAPTSPGTYSLFCAIHPSMQSELIVT